MKKIIELLGFFEFNPSTGEIKNMLYKFYF